MRIIAGNCHIQRVDNIDPRFATAQDGVDEVVTEVAMRAAVCPWLNARRQSVLLNLQATLDSLVVAILAGPVAGNRFVKSAVFASNATRFEVRNRPTSDVNMFPIALGIRLSSSNSGVPCQETSSKGLCVTPT